MRMASILPQGIVVNAPDPFKGSIAAQPLDLEDIAQFWKVYTTTKRRLLDPTAERLENYWWRIWGSRRRELNGATVARLFAHISDGQSFVPLWRPANRDDGTPPLHIPTRHGPGAASATAIYRSTQHRPSNTSSSTASKNPAPMPHPILKKTRGPSSTGPRPTARFISPHESDAETATTTDSSNLSSSFNSHVVVQSPSSDSQHSNLDKRANVAGGAERKSRSVALTASKKRPVIARRQSSQSSTDSIAKVEAQVASQYSSERIPSKSPETSSGKGKAPLRLQETLFPDQLGTLSTRKGSSSKSLDPRRNAPSKSSRKESSKERFPESLAQAGAGPSQGFRVVENQQMSDEEISEEDFELQRTLLEAANARVKHGHTQSSQQVQNVNEDPDPRSPTTSGGVFNTDTTTTRPKSSPSLGSTPADVAGQSDIGDSATPLPIVTGTKGGKNGKRRNPSDVFAKRPVLLASGNAASPISTGPLAKRKSQLTLLLQKDRAKTAERDPADGKKDM